MEKYLSESEIRRMIQCSRCKNAPTAPPVYICRTGHIECSTCFSKFVSVPLLEETDISTDSESDCDPSKRHVPRIGVIFPKESKLKNSFHSCPICKEEVLKTRNLLAENLIVQLESSSTEKPMYQEMKQGLSDPNCVECYYNMYTPAYPRYDSTGLTQYDASAYGKYQSPYGLQQYEYPVEQYGPEVNYGNQAGYYPEYEEEALYNNNSRRDLSIEKTRGKNVLALQSSVACLAGEPSRRPIRCPTHLCGRNIAVTALTSHFCFDHPDVPPVNVDFDVTSHLFVVPDGIPYNYGRCVAMLLIPNRFEASSTVSNSTLLGNSKGKNSLPLVVMASRLDCITSPQDATNTVCEDVQREVMSQGDFRIRERCKPISPTSKDAAPAGSGTIKTPLLVIWLAGIETNSTLLTTLQVTEKETNIRSVVYTGPVTSLRSSQNTTNVFEQGDCLVINSGTLDNIIGDRGGFDLHIVVH